MRPTPLFSNIQTGAATYDVADKATYKGIAIKTSILFLLTIASAILTAFFLPILIQDQTIVVFVVMVLACTTWQSTFKVEALDSTDATITITKTN